MEELLAYAILFHEKFATENEYNTRLDALFLNNPENEDLLHLEWETDIEKAIIYARMHIDTKNLDLKRLGEILISKLNTAYVNCSDIQWFARRTYSLWENLPCGIRNIEPFHALCYAGDSLSWGDEEQARNIYEHILSYYKD